MAETLATVLAFPIVGWGIRRWSTREIPTAAILLGVFALVLVVPLGGMLEFLPLKPHEGMPFGTFYFVSPYTALASIWDAAAVRTLAMPFGTIVPVWPITLAFYFLTAGLIAGTARLFRPAARK